MSFQLLIARGVHEGAQLVVSRTELRIGRGEENDLVLEDSGVSRAHTRIFVAGTQYLVEDLGSANGTLLNGEPVRGAQQLKPGDSLAIGTALLNVLQLGDGEEARKLRPSGVEVERHATGEAPAVEVTPAAASSQDGPQSPFAPLVAEPMVVDDEEIVTASGEVGARAVVAKDDSPTAPRAQPLIEARSPPVAEQPTVPRLPPVAATRPVAVSDGPTQPRVSAPPARVPVKSVPGVLSPLPPKAQEPAAEGLTEVGVPKVEAQLTGLVAASVLRRVPDLSVVRTAVLAPEAKASPGATDVPDTRADAPVVADLDEITNPPAIPGSKTEELKVPETAADRARRRRRMGKTLAGQLELWWQELPRRGRIAVVAAGAVTALAVSLSLWRVFSPAPTVVLPPEPTELSPQPVHYSFGLGPDVDYRAPDEKQFRFTLNAPTDSAAILRLMAQDISRDEVVVSVNGAVVASVPADVGVPDRLIEILIPPKHLRRSEENLVVFDQVKNPPEHQTWRVSELSVEILPVLPLNKAEAMRQAKAEMQQGALLYAQRDVAADNVYKAWKEYRKAWQTLLSVPEGERGAVFELARRRADDLGLQLDRDCGAILLEAKKQLELKNSEKAKEILESVPISFPGRDHRCQALADEAMTRDQL